MVNCRRCLQAIELGAEFDGYHYNCREAAFNERRLLIAALHEQSVKASKRGKKKNINVPALRAENERLTAEEKWDGAMNGRRFESYKIK